MNKHCNILEIWGGDDGNKKVLISIPPFGIAQISYK